jgi:hypothetical protein
MFREIQPIIEQGVLLVAHESAHDRHLVLVDLPIPATVLAADAGGMMSLFREIRGVKREDQALAADMGRDFFLIRLLDLVRGPWGTSPELLDATWMYVLIII